MKSTKINKKMRGAIIGYGSIAQRGHAPAYRKMEDVEIVAVADIQMSRLKAAREDFGDINCYVDYKELLVAEELDFVDIATSPHVHGSISMTANNLGIHVLCEKPITTSTYEAKRVINNALKNQVVFFPCHNYKHAPIIKAATKLIREGAIGNVSQITMQTFRTDHAHGTPDWIPDWRRTRKYSGGGIGMDHGSHSLYLAFMWMGHFPDSLTCHAFRKNKKYDVEDNVMATLEFENGTTNLMLTWTAGSRKVMYSIQGDKGSIYVNEDKMELVQNGRSKLVDIRSDFDDSSHTTWFTSLFHEFQNAIDKEITINPHVIEAYMCVQTIEKMYESAYNHCEDTTVPMPYFSIPEQKIHWDLEPQLLPDIDNVKEHSNNLSI